MSDATHGERWSAEELMVIVLSRELRDGEVGSPGGARSEIPMAAVRLAQELHAPNLGIVASASGFAMNGVGKAAGPLRSSTTDFRNLYSGTEAVIAMGSIFRTRRDFFFAGGMQIDRRGNINMNRLGADIHQPSMVGPGAAGLAYGAAHAKRYFVYVRNHDIRTFVERVDYRSSFGFGDAPGARSALGLTGGGPELVISPLAVMRFDDNEQLRLASVHPGRTPEEVQANTGFELDIGSAEVPTTDPPSEHELETLRSRVDVTGVLRQM